MRQLSFMKMIVKPMLHQFNWCLHLLLVSHIYWSLVIVIIQIDVNTMLSHFLYGRLIKTVAINTKLIIFLSVLDYYITVIIRIWPMIDTWAWIVSKTLRFEVCFSLDKIRIIQCEIIIILVRNVNITVKKFLLIVWINVSIDLLYGYFLFWRTAFNDASIFVGNLHLLLMLWDYFRCHTQIHIPSSIWQLVSMECLLNIVAVVQFLPWLWCNGSCWRWTL